MERAVKDETVRSDVPEAGIPRPFPGATYAVQSLGRWVDGLMGDRKARADAAARLEPLLMREEEAAPEPEPASIPDPIPGGSEPITRGDDPTGERR
jgi:hypothetical protein